VRSTRRATIVAVPVGHGDRPSARNYSEPMRRAPASPEVTVVIPTRNRSHLVGEAVATALRQEDVTVEVLVVDDASTDDTAQVLTAIDDPRVHVLTRRERGRLAGARNTGVSRARGQWTAFLDDDDLWSPRKLRL